MKALIKLFLILLICSAGIWAAPQVAHAQQATVSLQLFYDQLSPHGKWANHPDYGYIWIPRVHATFSPYSSDGHWVFTDDGWTWVSNYSWGWAPFHYGRWTSDPYYGWVWIPDTEWAPAWVSWRRSAGYFGWAPMGPGISVNIAIGRGYNAPNQHWTFVRDRDIQRPDINRYYINKSQNISIIKKSTVIVNTHIDNSRHVTYISGPDKADVQRVTGKAVKPVIIRENNTPGQKVDKNELHIYRPLIQKRNPNGKPDAPAKLVELKRVKPVEAKKKDIKKD